jgi:hypothetical protein
VRSIKEHAMKSSNPRRGFTLRLILASTTLCAGLVFLAGHTFTANRAAMAIVPTALKTEPPTVSTKRLVAALYRTGVTPDRLAAAGVEAASVAQVVADAREALTGVDTQLAAADGDVLSATREHDALVHRIQSGKALPGDREALQVATTSLSTKRASRDAALAGVLASATHSLNETQRAALTTILANRHKPVPLKYQATNRTAAQWVSLRDALGAARGATRKGVGPSETVSQLISSADSDAAVSAASSHLEANLASVTAAWKTALGE